MNSKEQEEHEAAVTEQMTKAQTIAEKLFGDAAKENPFASLEIFDYLDNTSDEEEFASDLKRTIDHAKVAFGTEQPTPEQVFGLFERIFKIEE